MAESDDIETLRHRHIVLRKLQEIAIMENEKLEAKNLVLSNENIVLKDTIQMLTNNVAIANKMMVNAITNNNNMKDDYRNRIQALETELLKYKNNE